MSLLTNFPVNSKMVRSFIVQCPQNQNQSLCNQSNLPQTSKSMFYEDDKNTKKIKKSIDSLSQCSDFSRPASDVQMMDLLMMSDHELAQKYNQDPIFKIKLDLKIRKIVTLRSKRRGRLLTRDDSQDENGDRTLNINQGGNQLTLSDIKKRDEENQLRLFQKYGRVFGEKRKI